MNYIGTFVPIFGILKTIMRYKRSDFRPISWDEYGDVLEVLRKKIQVYLKKEGIQIDTIVPVKPGFTLFPWENIAEELAVMNEPEYFYAA